jgi:hypothetical protein
MAQVNNIKDTQVKTDNGWIVSVRHQPYSDLVEVWIANQDSRGNSVCHFNKQGQMVMTLLKEGSTDPEPTMKINGWIWDGIRQAINGVEVMPDKQAVDSELKATKYHLEDIRKLLKLK